MSKNKAIITNDWYKGLVEEIDAIAVETVFNARQTILEGKLQIGELINKNTKSISVTELVQLLSTHTKLSERELYYCYQFHEKQDKLKLIPEFHEKVLSWNKVKKLMTGRDRTKPCEHENVTKITICEDCGKKV